MDTLQSQGLINDSNNSTKSGGALSWCLNSSFQQKTSGGLSREFLGIRVALHFQVIHSLLENTRLPHFLIPIKTFLPDFSDVFQRS